MPMSGWAEHGMMPSVELEPDAYQQAIAPVRQHLAEVYQPLLETYLAAVRIGDVEQMQSLAERLDEAADAAETLWSSTLFTKAMDLGNGAFVNEAAGAMAMLSDLWRDVARAHRENLDAQA
jgi:hypothetical protein